VTSPAPASPGAASDLADYATSHGLKPIGLRPPLVEYLRQVWSRRYFIVGYARARAQAVNADSRFGQFWEVLNPLLNVAVYFLVFGIILNTRGSVQNYLAFLVIGVFVNSYTQTVVLTGAKSISGNLGLIRAFHFPRAIMPIADMVERLRALRTSLVICMVVVLLSGEPLTWAWLLIVPAVLLQSMFNLGLAMIVARLTARVRDVAQLLPFLMRTWMYLSGVMYPLGTFLDRLNGPEWINTLLLINPLAVYIEIVRDALLTSYSVPTWNWYLAVAWAVLVLVFGFVYFWKAEERYGRG